MEKQAVGLDAILLFLRSLPLFEEVSQASLAAVARAARLMTVPKDSFIFFQSDPADAVYLVWRGVVSIQLENPEGQELVINEMIPGDCFGELAMLTGLPRSASAQAIVDSAVLQIPGSVFQRMLTQEPSLALHLLEITARRLQNSSKREEALAFHDAQQRLARQLLQMDQLASDKGYLTISQEELAQRAGLTRQTVTTILGRWRRMGWLLTGRGHIVLLNRYELDLLIQP